MCPSYFFLLDDFFEVDFFDEDFFEADFFEADFFEDVLRFVELLFFEPPLDFFDEDFFDDDLRDGTLPPSALASDKPIAIACLRLVTFFPEPPLLSVPRLRSCIAFSTLSLAFFPYLLAI